MLSCLLLDYFFSSRRRHTRYWRDWSSDVCSSDLFEGVVIKRQGEGVRETFTVSKQSFGVGVERTFPLHSPKIERIEVAARGDVRRAKLYYLRGRVGKRARVLERRYTGPEEIVERGVLYDPAAESAAAVDTEVPG